MMSYQHWKTPGPYERLHGQAASGITRDVLTRRLAAGCLLYSMSIKIEVAFEAETLADLQDAIAAFSDDVTERGRKLGSPSSSFSTKGWSYLYSSGKPRGDDDEV